MPQESIEARVARLEAEGRADIEHRVMRDREIRDIKHGVEAIRADLKILTTDKTQRDTAISLGKWLIGTGFIAWLGGGLIWAWEMLKASGR
jgi:hypothetical protein